MINDKHKFIFIHIPKCAGSSIEFLGRQGLLGGKNKMISGWDKDKKVWQQHCTILQLKQLYNIEVNNYFTFTFTRNPWDKAVSDYKSWFRPSSPFKDVVKNTTLKDYLLCRNGYEQINHLDNSLGRGDHFRSQYEYIIDENEKPIIDYVGKFETYQEDFNLVCDKIGIPRPQLPHKNKSNHKHYTEYYNDETREIVATKYARDIEYFGYKFEP